MVLLSGVFFPTDQLPPPVQAVAAWLPLTHAVALVRPLLFGEVPPASSATSQPAGGRRGRLLDRADADPAPPAEVKSRMDLIINGEPQQLPAPLSVAALLEARGLAGKRVAVERNGEIVAKSRHAETLLAAATGSKSSSPSAAAEFFRKPHHEQRSPRHRRQVLRLAPAGRHRQVQGLRPDPRRDRRLGRRDHHGRHPPHQHRPGTGPALAAGSAAARAIHHPAQHRRLLHGRGRGAHAAPRPRTARRPRAVQARSAGRSADPVPQHAGNPQGRRDPGQGRLPGHGVLRRRPDPGAHAGRHRLRRDHAAGLADRFRHGHPQSRGT
jgi:sulfur carrier protein